MVSTRLCANLVLLANCALGFAEPLLGSGSTSGLAAIAERDLLLNRLDAHEPLPNATRAACDTNSKIPGPQPTDSAKGSWGGWGADIYNNRWAASDAIVSTSNVGQLEQTCHKNYNTGVSAAPLVENGIAYFPTWSGLLVALDYAECKTIWQMNLTTIIFDFKPVEPIILTEISAVSRTTPVVDGDVLYLATQANALALAVNKKTGKLIDRLQISDHPLGIVTMSPTFYDGKIFLGTSSGEENGADSIPGYKCCSFIASMNALTLRNGRLSLVWTVPMAPLNSNFSGAAVWGSQPSIDPIRKQVMIATGNIYSVPPEYEDCLAQTANITVIQSGATRDPCTPKDVYQESVLALDVSSGAINWVTELSPLDAWNVACITGNQSSNPGACPAHAGPDADFGMAPTFVPGSAYTPRGVDVVVVGQKNGNLYALTAQAGYLQWATATSPDGFEGGLIWGVAVDDQSVYFTGANANRTPYNLTKSTVPGVTEISNSAWGAVSLRDGSIQWQTPVPHNATSFVQPSVVNDIVLTGISGAYAPGIPPAQGTGNWILLNKHTGHIARNVPLNAYFQGSAAAVHEYVLFGSGYEAPFGVNGSMNVWKVKGQS